MRSSKIRSEDRLHVMKVDDLEAISVSQLLGRVCTALGGPGDRGGIIDAYFAGTSLLVRGSKHRMLHVPLEKLHPLQRLPEPVVRNIVIDPDGSFLHWPEPDVHLGWDQFLQAVDPIEFLKAEQRNAGYNARYGRAIRKVRETAGIRQSQVGGLTDRQVRRIESGVCRASTAALNALAKAHALDVNAYLERVASAIPQG